MDGLCGSKFSQETSTGLGVRGVGVGETSPAPDRRSSTRRAVEPTTSSIPRSVAQDPITLRRRTGSAQLVGLVRTTGTNRPLRLLPETACKEGVVNNVLTVRHVAVNMPLRR